MARDIEEFLRRAAERRKQAQKGGGGKTNRPPARRQPPKQPPPRLTITEADVVDEPRNKPLPSSQRSGVGKESVSDHVNRYLDVSDIVQHVDELGDVIEQADERMEAHLDDVFDHNVGQLSAQRKKRTAADQKPLSPGTENKVAKGILKMLQNPQTVRQSIMIAEVLKRPNFDDDE